MRAGIYYRVSSDEQVEGFSLDAQRRLLRDFCATKGWVVTEEYADQGLSARSDKVAKRPAFKRMIEDAEAGLLDVVVVHKLDRFARNIRVTFEYLELLARHGVKFVAVAQDVDYTTPEGRMFMGMLATLAQYYSDNLAQETKKGKAERKAQGAVQRGHPLWHDQGGWTACRCPTRQRSRGCGWPSLTAEGRSDRTIAQRLNAAGYRTTGTRGANPFTKDTVRGLLRNRFYLGELPGERPGTAAPVQHGAVIETDLSACGTGDAEHPAKCGPAPRCHGERRCTASPVLVSVPHAGAHCTFSPRAGGPACTAPVASRGRRVYHSGPLAQYEQQIGVHLRTFTIPNYRERLRTYVAADRAVGDDAGAKRRALDAQLGRLKDLYVLGDVPKAQYLAERERIKREVAVLEAQASGADTRLIGLAGLLANVAKGWEAASSEQRNRLTRLLFEEIVIDDKRVAAVKPRPELAGFFALDHQARVTKYRTCGTDEIRTRDLLRDRQAC